MRVLFISGSGGPDYQCDMLLHGLRSLLGADAVDVNRLDYMYSATFDQDPEKKAKLYGRGFTLYGLLPDDSSVDRHDIENKITSRYFDLIIYGSIHRCRHYLNDVLATYDKADIVFVDGEDQSDILYWPLFGRGTYYKREFMPSHYPFAQPISFAIPEEKFCTESTKKREIAYIDPRDRGTYIYNTEADYYGDYQQSLFAYTMKKAGWDCLRHYEIMANHCVPIFVDLNMCPIGTMFTFPRHEILEINVYLETRGIDYFSTKEGLECWLTYANTIVNFAKKHLTTKALATRIISDWQQRRGITPLIRS